ncbi:MAG: hypothetical protein E7520_00655 [Ruminococcaceae bacterium]|nr:hypothetical protein [Oscillospiraceae bacterium]
MKRILLFLVVLVIFIIPSISAFAETNPASEDEYYISWEDFEKLEHSTYVNHLSDKSSGLITYKSLNIAKSGNTLIVKGETRGSSDVVKCGFTYIKIQQYKNGSWSDYKTYNDLYSNSNKFSTTKSITVASGYKYRAIGQHYAKKSLLSTEKIKSTTSSLSF